MSTTRRAGVAAAAVGLLAAALVGCGSDGGSDVAGVDEAPSGPSNAASTPGSTTEAAADVLSSFSDSFDDDRNGWALPPSEDGTAVMKGGDFVWESKQANLRPHLLATTLGEAYDQGRLTMTDVVVRASVTVERGVPAVGIYCRESPDTDADFQWYEFVVRDGYAAIRVADFAGNLDVLAETRDVEVDQGTPVALEATCLDTAGGTAALSLAMDGRRILETKAEHPLDNGTSGILAYDATEEESADRFLISWHDFAIEPA